MKNKKFIGDTHGYIQDGKKAISEFILQQKNAENKKERELQSLFEQYPFMLLPALEDVKANYNIFGNIIVSQPEFVSQDNNRSPDFLIVTENSLNLYFNFIELEDPSKKFFKKNGIDLTPELTQAKDQIVQWQSFQNNEIKNYCDYLLKTLYKDCWNNTPDKAIHYDYVLIYGFSDEVKSYPSRSNDYLQEQFKRTDIKHITFSRLLGRELYENNLLVVKKKAETNQFNVIGTSLLVDYDYSTTGDFRNIIGKEEMIQNSKYYTADEKEELIKKIKFLDPKSREEIHQLNMRDAGFKYGSDNSWSE
jgi:hypothetical protein